MKLWIFLSWLIIISCIFHFDTIKLERKHSKRRGCLDALEIIYKERSPDSVYLETFLMCFNYEK